MDFIIIKGEKTIVKTEGKKKKKTEGTETDSLEAG